MGVHVLWVTPAELGELARVGSLDVLVLVEASRWADLSRALILRAQARGTPHRSWLPEGADDLSDPALADSVDELRDWCLRQFEATLGKKSKDKVSIGVAAPEGVAPDSTFVLRFAAYPDIPTAREDLKSLLCNLSPASSQYLDVRRCIWARGTKVQVRVYGKGVRIAPATQEFVWHGQREMLDFTVRVV